MSWVTDIILLCGLEELPESSQQWDQPPPIIGLNGWLESRNWAPLVRVDEHIGWNSEKAFQACAYGAALNRLDVPAFLRAVAAQRWQAPDVFLLLLKNEGERKFTVYRMAEDRLVAQTG